MIGGGVHNAFIGSKGVAENTIGERRVCNLLTQGLVTGMMRIRGKKGNGPKPLIGEELFQVVEVQVTTGVLLLDGPPNPLEENSVDDVGAVRLANPPVSSATIYRWERR